MSYLPQKTLALLAFTALTGGAGAATVLTSTTAPTVDGLDEANLQPSTSGLKWFHDVEHDAGQTFTPASDAVLSAFTIQLNGGNANDGDPNENVTVRLGTITRPAGEFTFTDVYSESAFQTSDWNADDYVTFTFDTPQVLAGGVEYGIITDAQNMGDWHQGIPYIKLAGGYGDGHAVGRGSPRGDDLVFHADLSAVPEPSVAILGLTGVLGLLRRRRRV